MKYLKIFLSIFLCILIFSCASTEIPIEPEIKEEPVVEPEVKIPEIILPTVSFEGFWELISFEKDGEDIPLVPDTAPNILGFQIKEPDDNIYPITGFLGINYFTDGKVKIGESTPSTVPIIEKEGNNNKKEGTTENLAVIEKKPLTSVKNEKFSIEEFSITLRRGPEEHKIFEQLFKEALFGSDSVDLEFIDSIETLTIYNSKMKTKLIFYKKS